MLSRRRGGVLLHISSLSNDSNIGTIGKEAYEFIDFLKDSGMSYWQILPLNAIYTDPSPYASISSVASNIYLISLDKLSEYGLLPKEIVTIFDKSNKVNYEKVLPYKRTMLKKAYDNFIKKINTPIFKEYVTYCDENAFWLDDFALFISIKEYLQHKRRRDKKENDLDEYLNYIEKYKRKIYPEKLTKHFYDADMFTWPDELKFRDDTALVKYQMLLKEQISFYKFTQFIFEKEWNELHDYASKKGIKLIGDIPIFVNHDSCDVWVRPDLFYLDEDLVPTKISGVPPDYFSKEGQLWHNPLYKWDVHKKENYHWWKIRFEKLFRKVDVIRIDHFRAFDKFWAVPYGSMNAIKGKWMNGPSSDFFETLFIRTHLPIIAEDLGLITKSVTRLRHEFYLPGMFVTQFHLLNYKNHEDLNTNTDSHTVCYTGTHDNQTLKGWIDSLTNKEKVKVASFCNVNPCDLSVYDVIRVSANTKFNTFIVPMQDLLELGDEARMNKPGTESDDWTFRLDKNCLTDILAHKVYKVLEESDRLPSNIITFKEYKEDKEKFELEKQEDVPNLEG